MSVELRHVRYLMAIVEYRGFTRAAEALHVSQPTLSQQVRKLETTLGAALLDRSGRTVRLTDAGAAFLERARKGLRELAAAERAIGDVQDLSRGHLRLGVTPTFAGGAVAGPLADFDHLAPAIGVSVSVGPQVELEERLLDDTLDLALGFSRHHAPGVVARALYSEELHICVRADRDDAGDEAGEEADDRWLTEQRFALLPPSFATRVHVDRHFERRGVPITVAFEADTVATLVQVVARTSLTTVLPGHAIAAEPGVRSVGRIEGRSVVVMHRDGAYESAASTAFRQVLRAWRPDAGHD